jgi:hypothetical protein
MGVCVSSADIRNALMQKVTNILVKTTLFIFH